MKKTIRGVFLLVVCLGMMVFLIPSYSAAFESIKLGDESSISLYGFIRNNTGIFLQDQPFAQDGNQLATERTTLRGYMDWHISDKVKFWAAIEFAYEPWYPVEKGSITSTKPFRDSFYTGFEGTKKGSKEYSEYNNVNDVLRECYLELKPNNNLDIKIGRQIAIWGEALTSRVGDVVHPDDTRYTFAFANLEDTRIPSLMIRAIYSFTAINSSLELIFNPNGLENRWTVNQLGNFPVSATNSSGQRFGIYDPNLSRTYIPSFENVKYPTGWGDNARGGFRTNTSFGGYSFGLSYFHTQEYTPLSQRGRVLGSLDLGGGFLLPIREITLVYPDKDIIGVYANKQLTGNGPIPGVIRAEAIYVPNQPFNSLSNTDTIFRRDYVKYLIAYDLNGYFYPSWHNTAPINLTLEHVGEVIPNNDHVEYAVYATKQKKWNPAFNGRLSTNWRYNQISTEIIAGYLPWGHSGLLMPIVQYTFPWFNQNLSAELRYIMIFGNSNYKGLGILKNKDLLVSTIQYNW